MTAQGWRHPLPCVKLDRGAQEPLSSWSSPVGRATVRCLRGPLLSVYQPIRRTAARSPAPRI